MYNGSCAMTGLSITTFNGVSYTLSEWVEDLDQRITALTELVETVPAGNDFLEPKDIQPLFNNREVIFDV